MDIPKDAQLDFQVQALTGHLDKIYTGSSGFFWVGGDMDHYYVFTGESSGWSDTQTLTIGKSETPAPNQEPQQIEQEIIVGAAIAAAVIVAGLGLLVYLIKRK